MSLTTPDIAVGAAVQPLPISPLQIDGRVMGDSKIRALQIESRCGEHEQLKLSVIMPILDSSVLVNKPIFIRYGTSPDFGYFYGYTNNVSKPQSPGQPSMIQITALGFSSIMKLSPSRMFRGQTTEQILRTALLGSEEYRYQIGLAALPHDFEHQRLAQVGETDWEFMVRVAAMAGFKLFPYCGVVAMSHPYQALDYGVAHRTLEKSTQILDQRPLLEFIPSERIDQTVQDFEPEFTYFTSEGVQTNVPDVPPQRRVKPADYIYSQAHAQFITEGIKLMTGLYQTADVRIRGDAALRPGNLVNIKTGITAAATDSFDGLWFVETVSSFIDEKVFQTALKLCRDRYRVPKTGMTQNFYDGATRNFPTMRLANSGVWQSSWSN